MEHKYIINLIFQQPSFDQEIGQIRLLTKTDSVGYERRKDAYDAYDKFNRRGYVEMNTPIGKMTFNLVSVELVNVKKYEEDKLNQQEEEVNNNGGTEESTGIIDNASDEGHSSENESQAE